jgi:hypothetical protein
MNQKSQKYQKNNKTILSMKREREREREREEREEKRREEKRREKTYQSNHSILEEL